MSRPPLARLLVLAVLGGVLAVVPAAAQTDPPPDCATDPVQPPTPVDPTLFDDDSFATPIGAYKAAGFDESGAEIVAFDSDTARIFTINSVTSQVDILDASDPSALMLVGCLALDGPPTSVAVLGDGFAAVAYQATPKTDPGFVTILDAEANAVATVRVGSAVDALTVTPDGTRLLSANEGEIPDDYSGDPVEIPEGSVSVIDLPVDFATLTQADVTTVGFDAFTEADLDEHVRRSSVIPTLQQDFEPEYAVADETSSVAYVALQENSAIAVLDLETLQFTDLFGLPVVDHEQEGSWIAPTDRPLGEPDGSLDSSDFSIPDSEFALDENTGRTSHDVSGMPMPDGIAVMTTDEGNTYVFTAEEGDGREWGENDDGSFNYLDESRVEDLGGDSTPAVCADAYSAEELAFLGRLTVSIYDGVRDGEGCIEQLHAYGTRGMGIYDAATGERVWHSGDDFELFGVDAHPRFFNSDHAEAAYVNRNDNKGPEPEYVELGEIEGRTYAFVGLERISAVAVYDVTDPLQPVPVDYLYNRDFEAQLDDPANPLAGDLGPEGLDFVPAADSPTRQPLLVVGNEVSGTTTVWQVNVDPLPLDEAFRVFGPDRIETAVEVSQAAFGDGEADTVVLSRADDYADSLAGTPVAVTANGPLLITDRDQLVDAVAEEIARVLPTGGTVHMLGGEAALDAGVGASVTALGYDVVRIFGATRIETAVAVAEFLGDPGGLLVTTGYDFPDALAAGAAAAHADGAVLLTTSDVPHPAVDAYLAGRADATVWAVGGPAARAYPEAAGLVGATRDETAVAVAREFFTDPPVAGFARRDEFPEALLGGAHIAGPGGPLLLTSTDALADQTVAYICEEADAIGQAFVYGGPAAVSDATFAEIAALINGDGCP